MIPFLSFLPNKIPSHSQKQLTEKATNMVSLCFTTSFLLISVAFFFFSQAQIAAIEEVLVVPQKYGILGSARISSNVKKEVDGAGVSSIVEAREFGSRKMKLITRKALDGDRKVVQELDTSGTTTTGEYHLVVAQSLKMRSRGPRRSRGFVAFSADYHIPRPHPPRNN